ncbi:MAG: hypothetical protein GXP26_01265 [Planctomycetes bacterium]|nr:hypothetical protein [Planctomycetota bacterium]
MNLPFSSPDATDSVFSSTNSIDNTKDFRFALNDVLLDELVRDQLSHEGA